MNGFNLVIKQDEDDIEAAEIYVDAIIETRAGTNTCKLLLDTGAGRTRLPFSSYTAQLGSTGMSNSSGVFAGSSEDLVTLPGISLGPVRKRDLLVTRLAETSADARGLIGMDALGDHRCHFLLDQHRIAVDPPDVTHPDLQDLLLDDLRHPCVDVGFKGAQARARAVWDSGAGITVADTGFIEQHPAFLREAGRSTGTDAAGHSVETPMYAMAPPVIGNKVFPAHKVAGVDRSGANATTKGSCAL